MPINMFSAMTGDRVNKPKEEDADKRIQEGNEPEPVGKHTEGPLVDSLLKWPNVLWPVLP